MSLFKLEEDRQGAVVYGRDIVTGLPVEREIPTQLVVDSLEEHFNTIVDNVKVILERTPPELAADIYRNGVYLTGGASQTSHLAVISRPLSVPLSIRKVEYQFPLSRAMILAPTLWYSSYWLSSWYSSRRRLSSAGHA